MQDAFKRQTEIGGGRKMDGRERRRKAFCDIKYYMSASYRCAGLGNEVWWSVEGAEGRVDGKRNGRKGRGKAGER